MTNKDITATALVDKSPMDAFNAINDPKAWWGEDIQGRADRLGEEWTYRHKDVHISKQKVVELVPGKRVVWEVLEATMTFLKDKHEWTGTKIVFDIAPRGGKTEIRFAHMGVTPNVECFDICNETWDGLIRGSLKSLIETGKGEPFAG
jgi:hypothetical protein